MGKLNYREITKENFYDIIALSKTLTAQQQTCVAPNAVSIAEGSVYSQAYYRGIFLEDKPIGFFMLSIPDLEKPDSEFNDFYLWRFMIAYDYQHQHYGKETLDHIVSIGKAKGFKKLVTSCHMGDVSPYQFYIKYGFVDTNTVDDGEEVLVLDIL